MSRAEAWGWRLGCVAGAVLSVGLVRRYGTRVEAAGAWAVDRLLTVLRGPEDT